MREKKSSLHFAGREHSKKGIMATAIGILTWCVFLALCVYSVSNGGNAESVIGTIGILDALFALTGAAVALQGFKERDVYYMLPTVGMVLNGLLFVIYFALYFVGVALV